MQIPHRQLGNYLLSAWDSYNPTYLQDFIWAYVWHLLKCWLLTEVQDNMLYWILVPISSKHVCWKIEPGWSRNLPIYFPAGWNTKEMPTAKAEHSQQFLQHINSIVPHIQFTTETPKSNGSIAFLDTAVSPGPDNTLLTTVYRESNHTYQYLHNVSAKYTIFNTLTHWGRTVCANPKLLHKDEEHIQGAFQRISILNGHFINSKSKTTTNKTPLRASTSVTTLTLPKTNRLKIRNNHK